MMACIISKWLRDHDDYEEDGEEEEIVLYRSDGRLMLP